MRYLLILIGLCIPLSTQAQVVISEVMWAGTEVSSADEWLEIVNISEDKIELVGWSITKRGSDGSQVPMVLFEEDVELQPGQHYLISNYPQIESALTVEPDLVTSSVSLTNTKLFLQIVNLEGEIIDTVDDGVGVPFAGGKDPFSIMTRIDLFASGEEKSNWKSVPLVPIQSSQSSQSSISSISSSSISNPNPNPNPNLPSIIISEILTRPKDSDDYEWIEIANVGSTEVDIKNWEIKVGSKAYKIPARSANGYILKPDEATLFFRYQTGLNMPSDNGHIFLYHDDILVDDLPYSITGEEVSFGRGDDYSRELYCLPSPRIKNSKNTIIPEIIEQSGRSTDYTKVTLNLKAEVKEGSLKSAECFWDFDDGTSSKSCNPPSRSWDNIGVYKVSLTVITLCGDEITKHKDVVVLQKKKATSASRVTSFQSSSSSKTSSSFSSSQFTTSDFTLSTSASRKSENSKGEQKMYATSSLSESPIPQKFHNIPVQQPHSSVRSIPEVYSQLLQRPEQGMTPPDPPSSDGFPWILLFTQSAVWVVIAGKRYM